MYFAFGQVKTRNFLPPNCIKTCSYFFCTRESGNGIFHHPCCSKLYEKSVTYFLTTSITSSISTIISFTLTTNAAVTVTAVFTAMVTAVFAVVIHLRVVALHNNGTWHLQWPRPPDPWPSPPDPWPGPSDPSPSPPSDTRRPGQLSFIFFIELCLLLCTQGRKEGNVLFNTFYLRLYGIRHMVKDHSDSERGRKEGRKCFI